MTINLEDGSVLLEDVPWRVTARLTEADLLESASGRGADVFGTKGARHVVYRLGSHRIGQREFMVDLVFVDGCLASAVLSPTNRAASWDQVNDEQLIGLRKENWKWLREKFGVFSPGRFDWGSIDAPLDRKTGDAPIVLTYERQQ